MLRQLSPHPLTLTLSPGGRGDSLCLDSFSPLIFGKKPDSFSPSPLWGEGRGEGHSIQQNNLRTG